MKNILEKIDIKTKIAIAFWLLHLNVILRKDIKNKVNRKLIIISDTIISISFLLAVIALPLGEQYGRDFIRLYCLIVGLILLIGNGLSLYCLYKKRKNER